MRRFFTPTRCGKKVDFDAVKISLYRMRNIAAPAHPFRFFEIVSRYLLLPYPHLPLFVGATRRKSGRGPPYNLANTIRHN